MTYDEAHASFLLFKVPEFLVPAEIRESVPPIDADPCPVLALVRVPQLLPPLPLSAASPSSLFGGGAAAGAPGSAAGQPAAAAAGPGLFAAAAPPPALLLSKLTPVAAVSVQDGQRLLHLPQVEPSFDDWLARLKREAGVPAAAAAGEAGATAPTPARDPRQSAGQATADRSTAMPSPEVPPSAHGEEALSAPNLAAPALLPLQAQPQQPQLQTHELAGRPLASPQLVVGSAEHVRAVADRLGDVQVTLLVPARRGLRGAFPLNGTYFQVNEMFMDEATAAIPIQLPAYLLTAAEPRRVSFSGSVVSLCRGLSCAQVRKLPSLLSSKASQPLLNESHDFPQVAATFDARAMTCFRSFVPSTGEPGQLPKWLWVRGVVAPCRRGRKLHHPNARAEMSPPRRTWLCQTESMSCSSIRACRRRPRRHWAVQTLLGKERRGRRTDRLRRLGTSARIPSSQMVSVPRPPRGQRRRHGSGWKRLQPPLPPPLLTPRVGRSS